MSEPEKKEETEAPPAEPPAEGEPPATSKSSKKSEKPKKKKLSKKELARLKREKAEQERLEQEKLEAAKKAQQEKEEESRKRAEQQQRLEEEKEYIKNFRLQKEEKIQKIVANFEKTEDWELFSQCSHAIDVRSEADVNTFISQLSEVNETDINQLFEHIHLAKVIENQLRERSEKAQLANRVPLYTRCNRQIDTLQQLINQKIENITVNHLAFSDKFSGAKGDVQINGGSDDITYGMWVNLSKNPRIKDVTVCQGVTVEIPKPVAMASVAIRGIHNKEKPFDEKYLFIDRLLHCDFLQLPAPPKHIGTITIRQPPHSSSLVKIAYPLKNANAPQPPLNFRMALDEASLSEYCQDATIVMIKDGKPDASPITKCSIEDNDVLFSSNLIGTFGLAVPRYRHFPFQFWEISGQSPTSVEIYIQTPVLQLALVINGDGLVSMESPFKFENLTPVAAMNFLLERGINLEAPEAIEGIEPKNANVEEVLHTGIADVAVGFAIRCSKFNSEIQSDRAMLLFREKTNYEEEPNEDDDEKNIKESHVIIVKADHIAEVENMELGDTVSQKAVKEAKIHQLLLPMFFDNASEDVQKTVREAPPFLYNALLFFMNKLRLFSMTQ